MRLEINDNKDFISVIISMIVIMLQEFYWHVDDDMNKLILYV